MLSPRRLAANRANAQRSTGPRTAGGLVAASKNATRHGLCSVTNVIIAGFEDAEEYEAFVSDVIADLGAKGVVEACLAERVAQHLWRLRRVLRYESESLSQRYANLLPDQRRLEVGIAAMTRAERLASAVGELSRPDAHQLLPETISTIWEAVRTYLESNRITLPVNADANVEAARGVTVGEMRESVRQLECDVRDGRNSATPCRETLVENLIAKVHGYWIASARAWLASSEEADRGVAQQRTEEYLAAVERMAPLDRYETRLRRDITRTLRDLLDLQHHRQQASLRTSLPSHTQLATKR
jgi:hypothetical protein